MKSFVAAIALLLPAIAAADEPARAKMVEQTTKAAGPKVDKAAARLLAARELVQDNQWLGDIAHDAATTGRRKIPKLPDGVVVTVIPHEGSEKNPFGNIPTPQVRGTPMRQVTYRIAEGKRGAMRAIMWVDAKKIDPDLLKQ